MESQYMEISIELATVISDFLAVEFKSQALRQDHESKVPFIKNKGI